MVKRKLGPKKVNKKVFSDASKEYLSSRDAGSLHDQSTIEHRQNLLNSDGIDPLSIRTAFPSSTVNVFPENISVIERSNLSNELETQDNGERQGNTPNHSSSIITSPPLKKLCTSAQKLQAARQRTTPIDSESSKKQNNEESEKDIDKDSLDDEEDVFCPPQSLWIVDFAQMETNLNNVLCCKFCYGSVKILENVKARQGLGTKIQFRCENSLCTSHQHAYSFNTTEKKRGQNKFEINERNVLASRLIGKGQANALKYCSVMGLAPPLSRPAWKNHANVIDEAAIKAKDVSVKQAVERVKAAQSDMGKEVPEVATSFDASWSSRGWTARDGIVSGIAEETSQVLDVLHLTNSCPRCTDLQNLLDKGKLSQDEHMEKYLKHEESCCVNHEGSSSVSLNYNVYLPIGKCLSMKIINDRIFQIISL